MSMLRAEKIIDYLSDPLSRCLKDDNPYVRKTAALCVAKLYDIKPELAIEGGFVDSLRELVADSNPMVRRRCRQSEKSGGAKADRFRRIQVVANAVTALTDIHQTALEQGLDTLFIIDSAVLSKLLIALNECTEWGRIAILNSLARYRTTDEKEAEHICERVMPQFQHANGSVVLSAIKVSHERRHSRSAELENRQTGHAGRRRYSDKSTACSILPLGLCRSS
jgi:vesicle coat complex subunit